MTTSPTICWVQILRPDLNPDHPKQKKKSAGKAWYYITSTAAFYYLGWAVLYSIDVVRSEPLPGLFPHVVLGLLVGSTVHRAEMLGGAFLVQL